MLGGLSLIPTGQTAGNRNARSHRYRFAYGHPYYPDIASDQYASL